MILVRRTSLSLVIVAALCAQVAAQSLTPLVGFGGPEGWLAPGEAGFGPMGGPQTFLGTGNNERGIAYNPVTGNLLLLSRTSPPVGNAATIRILNGSTGAESGFIGLPNPPVTGGTFLASMLGVADDGAIYFANLASAAIANFNVYRLANEAAAPTVAHSGFIPITGTGTPRLGDTFDVIGGGANTRLVASGSGTDGYVVFSTADGLAYSPTYVNVPGDNAGDYRLGITFGATADSVIGTAGGNSAATNLIRFTTVTGPTLVGTGTTTQGFERLLDFAVIGGVPVLAVLEASNDAAYEPRLRMYDATNPSSLVLLADAMSAVAPFTANTNGTGQVKFGAITGNNAVVYAMSTNSGIQAFTFTIPEPSSAAFLIAGVAMLGWVRRRR